MKTTRHVSITGQIYGHEVKDGRKKLPAEIKAKKVCITLTPQAHRRGVEKAKSLGLDFSSWIEEKIYTETA